jgi:hypothetical protein
MIAAYRLRSTPASGSELGSPRKRLRGGKVAPPKADSTKRGGPRETAARQHAITGFGRPTNQRIQTDKLLAKRTPSASLFGVIAYQLTI